MDDVAAWLPLSHSVPDARVRLPSDRPRHDPHAGLPITENDGDPMGPGVCLYLGPPSRTYRRGQEPVVGYVVRADAVAPDAPAFPCDLGGSGLATDDIVSAIGTHRDARSWRQALIDAVGDWTAILAWDFSPPLAAVPDVIRPIVRPGDPGSWTPEIRSPVALAVDERTVHVAAIRAVVPTDTSDAALALANGVREVRDALANQGVEMVPFHPRLSETAPRALHRVVAAWLREHAPGVSP